MPRYTGISARSISSPSSEQTILIEQVLTESHNLTNTITSFPVENGSSISDNIIQNPLELSLTISFSSNPIFCSFEDGGFNSALINNRNFDDLDQDLPLKNAWYTFLNLMGGNNVPSISEGVNRSVYPPEGFTIITELAVYKNMFPTAISTTRNSQTGGIIDINISFKHVVITNVTRTTREVSEKIASDSGEKTAVSGEVDDRELDSSSNQNTTPAGPITLEQALTVTEEETQELERKKDSRAKLITALVKAAGVAHPSTRIITRNLDSTDANE